MTPTLTPITTNSTPTPSPQPLTNPPQHLTQALSLAATCLHGGFVEPPSTPFRRVISGLDSVILSFRKMTAQPRSTTPTPGLTVTPAATYVVTQSGSERRKMGVTSPRAHAPGVRTPISLPTLNLT